MVFMASALLISPYAWADAASAKLDLPNKEVDSATSPYIQGLKAKSDGLRDERKRERLKAYERKVFQEYLEFEAGSPNIGKAMNEKIVKWVEAKE